MKTYFLAGLLLSMSLMAANAQIRIPGSVHTLEKIEEAKAEAIKEGKPLVFVVTDPEST